MVIIQRDGGLVLAGDPPIEGVDGVVWVVALDGSKLLSERF